MKKKQCKLVLLYVTKEAKIENRKTHTLQKKTQLHTHLYFLFIIFLQVIICSSILFYFLTINDTNQKKEPQNMFVNV